VQQQFRSRHPSARGQVSVRTGPPDVRDRTPSWNRARTPSSDRLRYLNDREIYDPKTKRVLRTRTPSGDRAPRNNDYNRSSSQDRGRSYTRDASGIQRRPSRSPSQSAFGTIDFKELNLIHQDMCAKCGLRGHKYTDKSCSLYLKPLRTRCPSCMHGGHSRENLS
jgi:hypothetical protein